MLRLVKQIFKPERAFTARRRGLAGSVGESVGVGHRQVASALVCTRKRAHQHGPRSYESAARGKFRIRHRITDAMPSAHPCYGLQHLGHAERSIGFLKVLEHRQRACARREPGAVQGVNDDVLPCAFVARRMRRAWKSTCWSTKLISRYMPCAGTQNFEVLGSSSSRAHVAVHSSTSGKAGRACARWHRRGRHLFERRSAVLGLTRSAHSTCRMSAGGSMPRVSRRRCRLTAKVTGGAPSLDRQFAWQRHCSRTVLVNEISRSEIRYCIPFSSGGGYFPSLLGTRCSRTPPRLTQTCLA